MFILIMCVGNWPAGYLYILLICYAVALMLFCIHHFIHHNSFTIFIQGIVQAEGAYNPLSTMMTAVSDTSTYTIHVIMYIDVYLHCIMYSA